MAGYTLAGASGGTSVRSVLNLNVAASTPRRALVSAITFGMTAVASAAFTWTLARVTTAGTSTAVTPSLDDSADIAATSTAGNLFTVDPTFTAGLNIIYWPFYQNNSGRWVAVTDRQRKVVPATASNGLSLSLSAATTTIGGGGMEYEE